MYKNQESKSFTRKRVDISKAAARGVLWKKVLLEISQNSQENTCARVSFLIKLQTPPATLLKKSLWRRCFPVNFAKFLGTPFSQYTSGRLPLTYKGTKININPWV